MDLATAGASVNDDKSLFGIGLCADRLHLPPAFTGAVAGVDIHVERPETIGAVVARGIAQRLYGLTAMLADKAAVVFGKSFLLHGWLCFLSESAKIL